MLLRHTIGRCRKVMINLKNQVIRFIAVVLTSALFFTLFGCSSHNENENSRASVADCIINGREICFISDEAKNEWKEPLAKLLSNVLIPYGENGDILGYEATVDPNTPAIPQSYQCGLLDVTGDGIPELLVHPFGHFGSSGTATYFAYNIYSGQKIGEINGGNGQSWCYYYDTESNGLSLIGQYWLRGGWEWRDRYITRISYDESVMECLETRWLHTAHEIAGKQTDIVDVNPEDGLYTATWVETYPNTTYYVYNNEVYLDDYYAEYNCFVTKYIRIPETELILFSWDEVSNDEDDYITKGEKMAEVLITSKQKFIDINVRSN